MKRTNESGREPMSAGPELEQWHAPDDSPFALTGAAAILIAAVVDSTKPQGSTRHGRPKAIADADPLAQWRKF